MSAEITTIVTPLKIAAVVVVCAIVSLIYINEYTQNATNDRIENLASYTNGDTVILCRLTRCVYVEKGRVLYSLDSDSDEPVITDHKVLSNFSFLDRLRLSIKYLPEYNLTLYTLDWLNLFHMLSLYGIPIILFISFLLGARAETLLVDANTKSMDDIKDKCQLEGSLKTLIAATAHHEMLTPIAVIKDTINKISSMCCKGGGSTCIDHYYLMVNSSIDRLEAVLNQMASERILHKKVKPPLLELITVTLESLQAIYTEWNFTYEIDDSEDLNKYHNYKLESGTMCNVLNNLFKNSLEAGATNISVLHVMKSSTVIELYLLDNGHGISIPESGTTDIIFESKYSLKQHNNDLISVNTRLKTDCPASGDGLFLVKTILNSAGGDIALVKTSASGTVFKITLPVRKN